MIEIGTEVFITEKARVLLGLEEGLSFKVKDIGIRGNVMNRGIR